MVASDGGPRPGLRYTGWMHRITIGCALDGGVYRTPKQRAGGGRASGVIDLDEEADFHVVGYAENDYLGRSVARAGDVDADGIDDFWLGANGDTSDGAIYLIHGVPSP